MEQTEVKKRKRLSTKGIVLIVVISFLITCMAVVGVAAVIINNRKSQTSEYYNQKVAAFKEENANFSKGQIVFIGDSITDLYHLDDYYADLDKATYNRGIGGDTTQGVIDRLQVSLYGIAPSEIVLMIGTNDVNWRVSNDQIVKNYKYILDDIKTNLPEAKLFVMSIIPQNYDLTIQTYVDESNRKIRDINPKINELAVSHGYTYLDLYSLVVDDNTRLNQNYSDDGIHLNEAGFAVWTNLVKPLL